MRGARKPRGLGVADYAALQHLTPQEAAAQLGVTAAAVHNMEHRHGLRFARKPKAGAPHPAAPARDDAPVPARPASGPMVAAPAWTPDRDARILAARGRYVAIAALAAEWGVPVKRIEARWHVLRAAS